jgi:adenosylcobinamide kinase/adenosylcobinamide-phosphate guanylyltransferase
VFVATAAALDEEMAERIRRHREERGAGWETVEAPLDLPGAIDALDGPVGIVDCLTVWLGNVWHHFGCAEETLREHIEHCVDSLRKWRMSRDGSLYVVTNELGWGIVPADPGVRVFRDCAGLLNRRAAEAADAVFLCVCGVPMRVK